MKPSTSALPTFQTKSSGFAAETSETPAPLAWAASAMPVIRARE